MSITASYQRKSQNKDKAFTRKNQQIESEKTVTLPFNIEVAWQGFKDYIGDLEKLLTSKLTRLERLREKDALELSEREIKSIQYLRSEIEVLYNIYISMCHFREMVAFELERKISTYESKIGFLENQWKGASNAMLLLKDHLLTTKK